MFREIVRGAILSPAEMIIEINIERSYSIDFALSSHW